MTYHTNIRHQELVALLGTRNLYLRLVYAHIANYTQVKGAWCGTQRDLAAQLELPIATVSNQLTELIQKGHIVREANAYRSVGEFPSSTNEHPCSAHEQLSSPHEQNRSALEQNPAPIITSNNNMEVSSNSNNAQALAPDATTDNNRFDLFKNLYLSINPDQTVWENYRFAAQKEWNSTAMTAAKQDRILRALEQKIPDWLLAKNNPLFYLRDFPAPQRVEMSFNDYYIKNNQDSTPRNGWVMENPTGNKVVFAKYLFY